MTMIANGMKLFLLCCFLGTGLLISGCMTSVEQARMTYRSMAGYDEPSLIDASSGWVLVNSSSGYISLNVHKPLQITHYLKVWWHPVWKFLLVQNNYHNHAPFTISKRIHSNVQFTRHFNGIVGQTVYLLDLETQRGMANYNVYYELPPMLTMNIAPEPGGISIYHDPDVFFADTDIRQLLFREFGYTSLGIVFEQAAPFKHQDIWFSFGGGAGLWQPFLTVAGVNGADRGRWAQWNARDFFMQQLQIHLPGIYVTDNSVELTGMSSSNIREQLGMSTDTGPFSKAMAQLSPADQTRLSGYHKETLAVSRHVSDRIPGQMRFYNRVHELLWLKSPQQ